MYLFSDRHHVHYIRLQVNKGEKERGVYLFTPAIWWTCWLIHVLIIADTLLSLCVSRPVKVFVHIKSWMEIDNTCSNYSWLHAISSWSRPVKVFVLIKYRMYVQHKLHFVRFDTDIIFWIYVEDIWIVSVGLNGL